MTDYTFRTYAVDLMSEGAGESLVDLYGRDGKPMARISEDEAMDRRAFLAHLAVLLETEDYAEWGRLLGPMVKRHIEESMAIAREHEAHEARMRGIKT